MVRVSAEVKEQTRQRIVEAAAALFTERGFAATTTRDIAAAADIATGTLFNYFASKEALAMALIADACEEGAAEYRARRRGDETLAEDLFAFILAGLKRMRPLRGFVSEAVEGVLSPFARGGACAPADGFRGDHLEQVAAILGTRGSDVAHSYIAMYLYWTLYLGVVAFWSRDESPGQADTLVVLDQSVGMFVASLGAFDEETEVAHGADDR